MKIQLSKDESIIRTWDYATYKTGGKLFKQEHHDVSLTVTSKRIITHDTSEHSSIYEEIPLDSVISVWCEQNKKNIFWLIMGIILSVACLIVGIVCSITKPSPLGIIVIVAAVCLLILYIHKLGQGNFRLALKTNTIDGLEIVIGAKRYLEKGEGGLFRRLKNLIFGKKTGIRNMKINFAEVNDMCETIGAIILNNKAA